MLARHVAYSTASARESIEVQQAQVRSPRQTEVVVAQRLSGVASTRPSFNQSEYDTDEYLKNTSSSEDEQ